MGQRSASGGERRRIAIHAFTLFGAGHLQRAKAIADALAPAEILWLGHQPPRSTGHVVPYPVTVAHDPPTPADKVVLRAAGPMLTAWLREAPPDLLLTEHFPFGNRILTDGLLPLLQAARSAGIPVVGSVRDILGKDRQRTAWAQEAAHIANTWYDAILWHGDERFLGNDFPLLADLRPSVLPTGYVHQGKPPAHAPQERHWVATCGSGNRGGLWFALTALAAQRRLGDAGWTLTLVCGKGMQERLLAEPDHLPAGTSVMAWCDDLPGLLASAAVSVSQCGYNTFLDVVGSRAPAVFVPFVEARDEEQRLRAEALAQYPGYRVLHPDDPALADGLAEAVADLAGTTPRPPDLDLTGAETSARLLQNLRK